MMTSQNSAARVQATSSVASRMSQETTGYSNFPLRHRTRIRAENDGDPWNQVYV